MIKQAQTSLEHGSLPALPLQQQLWLMQRMAPDTGVGNISARLTWGGDLDLLMFQDALLDLVRRHPYLRTTIDMAGSGLVQTVHAARAVPLQLFDVRNLSDRKRHAMAQSHLRRAAESPIDEQQQPWIRASIIRVEDQLFEMALVVSHLICDGLSMGILCRELLQCYEARALQQAVHFVAEVPADLPQKLTRIADPQTAMYSGTDVELWLPYDRAPQSNPSYRGNQINFELCQEKSDRLSALSRDEGVSPFVTWLSLLHYVLYNYAHRQEILIDVITSGRSKEFRRMVGPFLQTSELLLDANDQMTFGDLLQANTDAMTQLELGEVAPTKGRRSHVMLDYQSGLQPVRLSDGSQVTPAELDNGAAIAELCLGVRRRRRRFFGHIKYDSDLFDADTIQRLIGHLQHAIDTVTAAPTVPFANLTFHTPEELSCYEALNQSKCERRGSRFVDVLFAERAQTQPQSVALVCDGQELTYAELAEMAADIRSRLQNAGVRHHDRVALWLSRGPRLVAAMLAVMQAGAAYVPIDPNHPAARQKLVLNQADIRCAIVDQVTSKQLPPHQAAINLDTATDSISHTDAGDLLPQRKASDVAYVMFTSGSTGQPKGVEVTHDNVTNFFTGMDQLQSTPTPGKWLAVTNATFDISVFELLWTLARGYAIVLESKTLGPAGTLTSFARQIDQYAITHFQCTPALMQMLLTDEACRCAIGKLEKIFVGGEAMPVDLAEQLSELANGDVYNMYGPTETTVWSLCWQLDGSAPVRIGKPLANQTAFVLDSAGRRVPIGTEGELYIGGDGVTNGYFRDQERTNARFINHPTYGRLFRTGDLVRVRGDGDLLFLGRNDHQVKINGHRIELGEIESALVQHPEVVQAAVIVQEKGNAKGLCGFFVPQGASINPHEVTAFLRSKLPASMVPERLIPLESMPLSSAGKVDRKQLAKQLSSLELGAPTISRRQAVVAEPPSAGDYRGRIKAAVCQELRVDSLPLDAGWMDLAISSLEFVRLSARIEREFNVRLPIVDFFRHESVAETVESVLALLKPPEPATVDTPPPPEFEEGVF